MRFFASFVLIFGCALAHAQEAEEPTFSFHLSNANRGCVTVDSVSLYGDFPNYPKGAATQVRLFYSTELASDIAQSSPYVETELVAGDNNEYSLALSEFCGFQSGKTFFKYGLLDANGQLVHFQSETEYDEYSNSVEVQ